jgi:hypothetical protein
MFRRYISSDLLFFRASTSTIEKEIPVEQLPSSSAEVASHFVDSRKR